MGGGLTTLLWLLFNFFFHLKLGEEADLWFSLWNRRQSCMFRSSIHLNRVCIWNAFKPTLFTYLENDNFAIISLEVERPCGRDEAVGLIHHILPKTSDQSQRVQEVNPGHHGFQLGRGKKQQHSVHSLLLRSAHITRWLSHTCSCRCSANGSWFWQPRLHAYCSSVWV